jgi:hypothetical protein
MCVNFTPGKGGWAAILNRLLSSQLLIVLLDGGCQERPPSCMGWDTAVADTGPTRPLSFYGTPHPCGPPTGCLGLSLALLPISVSPS